MLISIVSVVFSFIAVVFAFGILVFLHELGHFIAARKFGVRVEKFTLGLGPELAGKTIGQTRYSICAIPLGGATKLAGEFLDEAKGKPDEFFSQKWYRRIGIVLAGPVMSYILAFVFFFIVTYFWGVGMVSNKPVVGGVMPDFPADAAGIKPEDKIVSIDGKPIKFWTDIAEIIHPSAGRKLKIKIVRYPAGHKSEKEMEFEIIPKEEPSLKVGLIGISPMVEEEKVGIFKSIDLGAKQVVFATVGTLKYLIEKIRRREKPEVAGPVGIVQFIAKAARTGLNHYLFLVGWISAMLGLFNLFPIPLLDGGHIFLYLGEGITGKPLNKKVVEVANIVGLSILVTILLYATYSDIVRLGVLKFFSK